MTVGAKVILFNGDGFEYTAEMVAADRAKVELMVHSRVLASSESNLKIHLAQGISRGQKMDYVIQKSVECGVSSITPLMTQRCGVKINAARMQAKVKHWQLVAISACEQSGRCCVPVVNPPMDFSYYLDSVSGLTLMAHPGVENNYTKAENIDSVNLLIGPEGGFSEDEFSLAQKNKCAFINLGPRILRTETAPIVGITLLQNQFGDLKN